MMSSHGKGLFHAVSAYTIWGVLPLYWKLIKSIPAYEILCHRIIWSLLLLLLYITARKRWSAFRLKLQNRNTRRLFLLTSLLIGFNWFLYIWAVNSNHVVDSSLAYFINPLISIFLGVFVLREHLRPAQWTAISFAFIGILYLTFIYGTFPWVAAALALTFGFYGLLRKMGSLGSVEGLTFETMTLFIPALAGMTFFQITGTGAVGHTGILFHLLLIGSGPMTAIPMTLFASAVKRIPLSTVGILQYIAPIFQFLLGVFIFGEIFTRDRLIGFIFIWIALVIYSSESLIRKSRRYPGRTHPREVISSGK